MAREDGDAVFLAGSALSDRIRKVCAADQVDCAVAFWGKDMRDALFPNWADQQVRIVCDIAMQGTTRAALMELGAPDNEHLTVRDGLHAKVYISKIGAVVGSANASERGVGKVPGRAGKLLEAGVCFRPGTVGYSTAQRFFASQFDPKNMVRQADLDRAATQSHEPGLPVDDQTLDILDLFDRLRLYPERFGRISIALTDEEMDDEKVSARVTEHNERASKAARIGRGDVFLQTEDRGGTDRLERTVLLIHKEGRNRSVTGYVNAYPLPAQRADIGVGRASWAGFCRAVRQPDLKKRLAPSQWATIGRLLTKDEWLFTAERFAEVLADENQPTSA